MEDLHAVHALRRQAANDQRADDGREPSHRLFGMDAVVKFLEDTETLFDISRRNGESMKAYAQRSRAAS
eukprot:4359950-Alexandrium_andersonii.AAC.1